MNVQQNLANLFAPTLSKKYCDLFYVITIVQFLFLALAVVALFFSLADFKKNKFVVTSQVLAIVTLLIQYIYNRVLYTMCSKSLA